VVDPFVAHGVLPGPTPSTGSARQRTPGPAPAGEWRGDLNARASRLAFARFAENVKRRTPKPLQGEDAPGQLLSTTAAGTRRARYPWPERDLAFLATALLAGLRLSELLSLSLGSIDGRPGERRINVMGKGRKERTVPIEEPLQELIDTYMATRRERFPGVKLTPKSPLFVDRRGDRLKRGGAYYLVERSYQAAGLTNRVPAGAMVHALRHTYATRLAEDGASATEIQALLGHESLNTSQGYIDATANATRQAARANRTYRVVSQLTAKPKKGRSRAC
jgi:integrase/recombinase XerD